MGNPFLTVLTVALRNCFSLFQHPSAIYTSWKHSASLWQSAQVGGPSQPQCVVFAEDTEDKPALICLTAIVAIAADDSIPNAKSEKREG
jgi:hypothetical protein